MMVRLHMAPDGAGGAPAQDPPPGGPPPADKPPEGKAPEGKAPEGQPAAGHGKYPWLDQLSPELRTKAEFDGLETPTHMAKAYLEAKAATAKAIILPDPNDPAQVAAFQEKMNIPKDGKYKIDRGAFKDVPEVGKIEAMVQKAAAKSWYTEGQAQGMFDGIMETVLEESKATQAAVAQKQAEFDAAVLKSVDGDEKKATALKTLYANHMTRYGSKELIEALRDKGVLFDVNLARKAAELEMLYADDHQDSGGVPVKPKPQEGKPGQFRKSDQWKQEFGEDK